MQTKDSVILRLQHTERFVFRHWGTALQEGWVEPSDQARGRGEGATATRHPSPLWQTEQGQWEPVAKTRSPSCIWTHHCRNGDCIHKGVFLPRCFRKHALTIFQNINVLVFAYFVHEEHSPNIVLRLYGGSLEHHGISSKNYSQAVFIKNNILPWAGQTTLFVLITPPVSSTLPALYHLVLSSIPAVYVIWPFVPMQILESSQSLLCVLKKEAGNLSKATEPRKKERWWQW